MTEGETEKTTSLDIDHGLPVGVVIDETAADPDPQVPCHLLGQARVGVAGEEHHAGLVSLVHCSRLVSHQLPAL